MYVRLKNLESGLMTISFGLLTRVVGRATVPSEVASLKG